MSFKVGNMQVNGSMGMNGGMTWVNTSSNEEGMRIETYSGMSDDMEE